MGSKRTNLFGEAVSSKRVCRVLDNLPFWRSGSSKRVGQMIFEFLIAAMVFFGIIFYILNYLSINVATFSSDAYNDMLQSRVTQVSELLVRTKGVWINNTPISLGLVKEWPVLDGNKINSLAFFCDTNYTGMLDMLDLLSGPYNRTYNVHVLINDGDVLDCGFPPKAVQVARIRRFALSETKDILKIDVTVW